LIVFTLVAIAEYTIVVFFPYLHAFLSWQSILIGAIFHRLLCHIFASCDELDLERRSKKQKSHRGGECAHFSEEFQWR